jgi:hypothetical protein
LPDEASRSFERRDEVESELSGFSTL